MFPGPSQDRLLTEKWGGGGDERLRFIIRRRNYFPRWLMKMKKRPKMPQRRAWEIQFLLLPSCFTENPILTLQNVIPDAVALTSDLHGFLSMLYVRCFYNRILLSFSVLRNLNYPSCVCKQDKVVFTADVISVTGDGCRFNDRAYKIIQHYNCIVFALDVYASVHNQ